MNTSILIRSSFAALAAAGFLAASPTLLAKDGTTATPFKLTQLPTVKIGLSSVEVEHALGQPDSKLSWFNGTTTWAYATEDSESRFDVDFDTHGKTTGTMVYERMSPGN